MVGVGGKMETTVLEQKLKFLEEAEKVPSGGGQPKEIQEHWH